MPHKIVIWDTDIENKLAQLSDFEIDNLTFGAIKIDKNGKVLMFNSTEANITGRLKENVIGKNFFDEVAPCTKSDEFYGRFIEGVQNNNLNVVFEYLFDYQMEPTKVTVQMKKSATDDNYWIFVKRL